MRPRTFLGRSLAFFTAMAFAVALRAAVMGEHSALDPAGPQAKPVTDLTHLFVWVCGAVWVIVMLLLVAALRRRAMHPDYAPLPPADHRRYTMAVSTGLAVTTVIVFGFLLAALRTDHQLRATEGGPDAVTVRVTGHQWWWELYYEDNNPAASFTAANEIHIPVGRPVLLKLQTADVIHSLWVPKLAGKKDLIPGRENRLWIKADHPGVFGGQCAEYCGLQHAHMGFLVIAEPAPEFEKWRQAQRAAAAAPTADSAKRGQGVFRGSTCVMCHTIQGTPAGSRVGPDLTHLAGRLTLGAASLPNNRENLAAWIADPTRVKPGTRMPSHSFSPDELNALLDYLEELK
jgi:cytochrome c oxidase subunit 2